MSYPPSDWELLHEYVTAGSQAAFSQLAERYLDFVYSTALRRTGRDRHLAEDVTQAVFLILAQKACTIRPGVVLTGWLHQTTGYAAANALKHEARHRRKQEALRAAATEEAQMIPATDTGGQGADWEAISPLLDGALDRLGADDRDAVLLRFIHGKSHRDVGQAIGISEEAARKRIDRAVARLREFFLARGVTVPAAAIGTLLATNATEAAPVTFAVAGASAGASTSLANGTLAMMAWAKTKLVAACVAATLLLSTAAIIAVNHVLKPANQTVAQALAPNPTLPALPVLAQQPAPADAVKPIEGTIFGIDGEPLPGAEVYFCTQSKGVNAFTPNRSRNPPVITENDGKFSFPATKEEYALVAVFHPDGFAQVDVKELAKSPRIFIQPWARIEGVLLDGDKPQPGESIFVGAIYWTDQRIGRCITHQTTVKTDKDGRFVVNRIAPIDVHVYRQRFAPYSMSSKWDYVHLKPGETAKVQLGGVGRHVMGRLLPPAGPVPGVKGQWKWHDPKMPKVTTEIMARFMDVKQMPMPEGQELTPPQRWELERAWKKTPEGTEYFKHMFADTYPVQDDGSFRLEDLIPGKYALTATARQDEPGRSFSETIATAHFDFEVPALPAGQHVAEPLDIGQIKIDVHERLIVGEPAPDFVAESLDGQALTLASFKGKYLLLSVGSRPMGDEEWGGLKKAYESFSGDPQFAMLTIHLQSTDNDNLKAELKQKDVRWPQAVTGAGGNARPLSIAYQSGYGVCLIDPDGKAAAKLFHHEKAETEVAKAFLSRR